MVNYKFRNTPLQTQIGNYLAGSAEASVTFSFPEIDFDEYAYLILHIDATATLVLSMRIQINGITGSTYYTDGNSSTAGSDANIGLDAEASGQLASTGLFSAVNRGGMIHAIIGLSKSGSADRVCIQAHSNSSNIQAQNVVSITETTAITGITSVKILTSTSTWQTGTRITLYKVKR